MDDQAAADEGVAGGEPAHPPLSRCPCTLAHRVSDDDDHVVEGRAHARGVRRLGCTLIPASAVQSGPDARG